jgi:hypothetical protein
MATYPLERQPQLLHLRHSTAPSPLGGGLCVAHPLPLPGWVSAAAGALVAGRLEESLDA